VINQLSFIFLVYEEIFQKKRSWSLYINWVTSHIVPFFK